MQRHHGRHRICFGRKIRIVRYGRLALSFPYYDNQCHTHNGKLESDVSSSTQTDDSAS